MNSRHNEEAGVVIYHKNIYTFYKNSWINQCIADIRNQTFNRFIVYEINYGDDKLRLWPGSRYYQIPMKSHIEAMNFILDECFKEMKLAFNINLDDRYQSTRFSIQMRRQLESRAHIVSTNYIQFSDQWHGRPTRFHKMDLRRELGADHNIISHPAVLYTKEFWEMNKYYDVSKIKYEDMDMWKKALLNGTRFFICPEPLHFYRIHENSVGRTGRM